MSDQQLMRINLSLVSHTNIGKTTLARTLLGRDIGEVADRPHVTETNDDYVLIRASDGCSELVMGHAGLWRQCSFSQTFGRSRQPVGLVSFRSMGPHVQ